jgi:hypothetical protein
VNIHPIKGATRVLGEHQGYFSLPVRDEVVNCTVNGVSPSMVTEWKPTPEELAAILAGAPIQVRISGTQHPPIMLGVGDVPES